MAAHQLILDAAALVAAAPVERLPGGLRLLRKALENVQRAPLEPKFRTIKLDNATVAAQLVPCPGALALLRAVGFVDDDVPGSSAAAPPLVLRPQPAGAGRDDEAWRLAAALATLAEIERRRFVFWVRACDLAADAADAAAAGRPPRYTPLEAGIERCRGE